MAKAAAHESSDEEMGDEQVYEVKRIKKHERKTVGGVSALRYKVSWVGFPNDDDDTWEPEENVNETAMELVEKYWTKVDEAKRYQRYDPTTAKGKAAKKRSSRASEAASTPAKRGRSSTATVQLSSDEDDAPAEKPTSKRKGRQSNASVASASKKAKKAASPEANSDEEEEEVEEVEEKPKKGGKKVKADAAEAEEEEVAAEEDEEIAEGEGYQGGRAHHDWEELEYADKKDWEDEVEAIETVEQDGERIKFWVVWKELDNVASWVPNDVCKERCPLKLLEFYETHLKFQIEGAHVDGSGQEDN